MRSINAVFTRRILMLADSKNEQLPVEQLLRAEAYSHDVSELQLLETHISWIILTGKFAYKIKKPVQFDFVDYSTPENRKRFCDLEVKLNRRFAPDLYLGVVPIFDTEHGLQMGDEDWMELPLASRDSASPTAAPAVHLEYAVKMNQFSQDDIVASRLDHPTMTDRHGGGIWPVSGGVSQPDRGCGSNE